VSNLVIEILLRLAKAGAAVVLGIAVWVVCVGIGGATPSVELGLLCWLSGAAVILLVESGPL
jgi:hypothetical protein